MRSHFAHVGGNLYSAVFSNYIGHTGLLKLDLTAVFLCQVVTQHWDLGAFVE